MRKNSNPAINIDVENDQLSIVLQEYISTNTRIQELFKRVTQTIGLIVAILALSLSGVLGIRSIGYGGEIPTLFNDIPLIYAWIMPFILDIALLFIILASYEISALVYQQTKITKYLKETFGDDQRFDEIGFLFNRDGLYLRVTSLRSGYIGYRVAVYILAILSILGVGMGVHIAALLLIQEHSKFSATIFFLSNAPLVLSITILWYDSLFPFYKTMAQADQQYKASDGRESYQRILANLQDKKKLLYKIVPRPIDLLNKGMFFVWGFVVTWAFFDDGIEERKNLLWNFSEYLPSGPLKQQWLLIIIIGIVFFFVEEFLVQQAKLLWDDIRDFPRDQHQSDMNKRRGLVSGSISQNEAIVQMIVRWVVGAVLAFLLDIRLFIVVLLISILQIVYELFVKPRGGQLPIVLLLIVTLGWPLRFISGALALNVSILQVDFVIYLMLVYFVSIGIYASYALVDYRKMKSEEKDDDQLRSHAEFFGEHGERIQRRGLGSALICGSFLATYYVNNIVDVHTFLATYVSNIVDVQTIVDSALFHFGADLKYPVMLMLVFLACVGLGRLVYFPLAKLAEFTIPRNEGIRTNDRKGKIIGLLIVPILIAICFILFGKSEYAAPIAAVAVPLYLAFYFEAITYDELSFTNLINNFPLVYRGWLAYLFSANSGIELKRLAVATLKINEDWSWSVPAEILTDFLEVAKHLQESGYKDSAAHLAGAVLENRLRGIADARSIKVKDRDDLSALNEKLAEAKVYTCVLQKQIQEWSDIRNHADHGRFDQYSASSVTDMIHGVENLLTTCWLSAPNKTAGRSLT